MALRLANCSTSDLLSVNKGVEASLISLQSYRELDRGQGFCRGAKCEKAGQDYDEAME